MEHNPKINFSLDELETLSNILNEVMNGPEAIDDNEFHSRLGVTKQDAEKLAKKIREYFDRQ